MKKPRLTIHEAGHGYIGRLLVSDDFILANAPERQQQSDVAQTIFVLDRSGSMGQNVQRMVNVVLPAVARRCFNLTSYTLITFDTSTETIVSTVADFESMAMRARGVTNMAGVFQAIADNLDASNPHVRIIAISDGEIWDTDKTLAAAKVAASKLKQSFSISVMAVRLFTSSSQPDTRALASILQLNTSNPGSIVDVEASSTPEGIEHIIDTIGTAISDAGPRFTLTANTACFLQVPWAKASTEAHVNGLAVDEQTSIFLTSPPNKPTLNGVDVDIVIGDPVTHDTLQIILDDKIKYFIDQLRVLKVLNSPSAEEDLARIVAYFKDLEESLPPPSDLSPLLEDRSLAGRAKYMKASLARRLKSVTTTMQSIANDERVANLNMAQQAEYLRQAGDAASRCSRALARRAEASGFDFAATMRAEILAMAAHMDGLDNVDDSHHAVSFYSQATTLEGIRCMVELAKEPDVLNQLSAADMLRLFNIVGIPAVAPVGDFPDPMTYRLDKFLYGAYISVADITMAMHQGGPLKAPGQEAAIVTAIPFFEDRRVQQFLQRYARSSLEYSSSIGMRRMICEVPKTYPYTICAGIWKTIEELDKKGKTEIRVKNFQQLVHTYEEAIEGYFDHILPLLEDNQDPSLSYSLGHNGITNMIAPILHKIRNLEPICMSRILRALYSFETYQVMRRAVRNGGPQARQDALDEILGVDFSSSRATDLPPLFTRDEPRHCSEAMIDSDALSKYTQMLWFVPYATLIQPFFTALMTDNPIQALQAIPPMSSYSITKALGLPSSITLQDFLLFNVVEGLLYGDKASRVDKDTNKPKLGDLGNPGEGANMIYQYVTSRYAMDYAKRLKVQMANETKILQNELIAKMLSTKSASEFESCIKSGHHRGCVSISIDQQNSKGFSTLLDSLMDTEQKIPERAYKLYTLYSGRSPLSSEAVFNGGNLHLCDWKPLQALLISISKEDVWNRLQEDLCTRGHMYRGGSELANRHGHSNDLKSYFAYGCQTLQDYHDVASEAAWSEYIAEHRHCCGVAEFLARAQAIAFTSQKT